MKVNVGVTIFAGLNYAIMDENEVIAAGLIVPISDYKRIEGDLKKSQGWPVTENGKLIASANFANTSKLKKVFAGKIITDHKNEKIKAISYTLINNSVSSKTGNMKKQYFLVKRYEEGSDTPRDIEDMKNEVKERFLKNNLENLPVPIIDSWKEYFWEEISQDLKVLKRIGSEEITKHPMDGFVLSLPNIQYLQNKIEKVHAKSEFMETYKMTPKLPELLTVADIKGWSKIAKQWPKVLEKVGGKETFQKKDEIIKETIVRGFELFLDNDDFINNIDGLHQAGLRGLTMEIRNMPKQQDKDQFRTALKKVLSKYKGNKKLITLINNFKDLFKSQGHNIREGNWEAIEKYLENIHYDNVDPRAQELAKVCGRAKVPKTSWKKYEDEFLDNLDNAMTAPKTFPTVSKDVEGTKLMWETMDMTNPEAWVVGIETYCCQHLDNVGGDCVRFAARNPSTSGILKISEKGRTVAQSFFWLVPSTMSGQFVFVLDNIEVAGSEIRSEVVQAYKDFAKELKKYAPLFRIRALTVGTQYTNLSLDSLAPDKAKDHNYGVIPSTLGYSDARNQKLVKEYKLPQTLGV